VTLTGASLAGTAASNYTLGSVSTTTANITAMPVNPNSITVTPPSNLTYNGSPMEYTATAASVNEFTFSYVGLSPTVYQASSMPPTNAGNYSVTVTPSGSNYSGSKSVTFTIAKQTLTPQFTGNTSPTYDGTAKALSAATTPSTIVNLTYDGSSDAPTSVGIYTVLATVNDPNYQGSASTSLTITAASLATSAITLTPQSDGSYTASGPEGSTFSYSYAGRSANGIATSYSSASAPTAPGYYTVTATATGNYSGSKSADYFVAGPVAVSDAITKPAGNPSLVLTLASLLANDVRITPAGAVATDGLSITGVTNGSGNSAQIDGGDILFSPGGASPETFTYTLSYGGQAAIGTVTVTTETQAPTFTLQIVKVGTATLAGGNTTVTHDFIGVPGQTYAVEYSTDLTNWTSAGNRSTGATGSFSLNITKVGDMAADWNAHMFFRASLVR
jgi:hypothetical protein